jgi:AcrR family transcriptional regulator
VASRKRVSAQTARKRRARRELLGREAWIEAARDALLEEGVAGMEINKLAKRLGVTRGGFYWFFKSSAQLREELLAYWERTSTAQFEGLLRADGANGMDEFRAFSRLWIDEKDYDPAWDAAIRDWARTSPKVSRVVRRVDDRRIDVLHRVFLDLGYADPEAFIRARVTYYHQVGYYALGVRESHQERMRLMPYYVRVLSGRSD